MFEKLMKKNENEINQMSPITWAYVGDSVYELYIREYLVNITNFNSHKLHILAIRYVKAEYQASILKRLIEDNYLNEAESDIVKRGRNADNHHLPKHATYENYMYSTAFEALLGYLFLCKKSDRVEDIINRSIEIVNEGK